MDYHIENAAQIFGYSKRHKSQASFSHASGRSQNFSKPVCYLDIVIIYKSLTFDFMFLQRHWGIRIVTRRISISWSFHSSRSYEIIARYIQWIFKISVVQSYIICAAMEIIFDGTTQGMLRKRRKRGWTVQIISVVRSG